MIITFFGASVTAQGKGYVTRFKLKSINNDIKVIQKGYGSMHMSDAGICYLDNIILDKPDICFIDWFSTGFVGNKERILPYLNTIIKKLNDNKIKLVFLYLPRHPFEEFRGIMYDESQNYLKELGIPFIDIKSNIEKNNIKFDEILRDTVHTTEKGGEIYGDIVYEWFIKNVSNLKLCNYDIPQNEYYNIKYKILDSPIEINDKYEIKGDTSYIRFLIDKSPHNGIVLLNNKRYNFWDQWCHYTRKCLTGSLPSFKNKLLIEITNEDFDKSKCKIKDLEWEKYEKKIIIHEIFYIGNLEF
tara:strand:- start:1427 stop:2326 length:900 start_codon:yes stop_codon:yes gene_type:complete